MSMTLYSSNRHEISFVTELLKTLITVYYMAVTRSVVIYHYIFYLCKRKTQLAHYYGK